MLDLPHLRLQIVAVEQLLASPAPPIRIPMARSDTYRKAAMRSVPGGRGRSISEAGASRPKARWLEMGSP